MVNHPAAYKSSQLALLYYLSLLTVFLGIALVVLWITRIRITELVRSGALLVELSVEMHFFIWARLPSVQVSPHHRRSTSTRLLERQKERAEFHYIGLTLQSDNSKDLQSGTVLTSLNWRLTSSDAMSAARL